MEEDTSTAPLLQVLVEGAAFHSRLGRVRGATLLDRLLRATLAALMAQGAEVSAAPKALMSRGVTDAVGAAEPEGVKLPVTEGVRVELPEAPAEPAEEAVIEPEGVCVRDGLLELEKVGLPLLVRVAVTLPAGELLDVPLEEELLVAVALGVLVRLLLGVGVLLLLLVPLELLEVVALGEGEAEGGPSAYTEPPESEKTTTELPPSTGELWMPSPLTPRE